MKYRGLLGNFAEFAETEGTTSLSQLSVAVFDAYRASRKPTHSPKSMFTDGVVLKQFLRWCKTRRLIVENPLEDYKLRKPPTVPKEKPSLRKWT